MTFPLYIHAPGSAFNVHNTIAHAEPKKRKADALSWAFATRSWTAIEMMHPEELAAGFRAVQGFVQMAMAAQPAERKQEAPTGKAKA